jgi:hypothetical protein
MRKQQPQRSRCRVNVGRRQTMMTSRRRRKKSVMTVRILLLTATTSLPTERRRPAVCRVWAQTAMRPRQRNEARQRYGFDAQTTATTMKTTTTEHTVNGWTDE